MNFNLAICAICERFMTHQQVQEGVYWLPDMTEVELSWARYEGFEHRFAHAFCWKRLKEKKRKRIRYWAFKGQEPRSQGELV